MKKNNFSESIYASKEQLLALKKKAQMFSFGKAKLLVDVGFGEHVSPFKTKGLDFQEVRVYQPGDDVRLIDWKITAKHNKPYTKLYTDEKEQQVFVVVDMRGHMKFATKGVFKSVVVAKCAAFLSFLAENKNDKIGFCVLGDDKITCAIPQMGKETLSSFLDSLSVEGDVEKSTLEENTLLQAMVKSEQFIRRGANVFVISDFVDYNEEIETIIRRISKKATCSLIHIYDGLEKEFPKGVFPVTNGVETIFLNTKTKSFQNKYRLEFEDFVSSLLEIAKNERVGYLPLTTEDEYINMLAFYCKGGLL